MRERHEDHLVAAVRPPVPRAVLTDEHAIGERPRQGGACRRRQAQRSRVRSEREIRSDSARDQVWPLWLHALVDMLAIVAVRPPIEAAIAHRREIVGHQITADLVALVDHCPQRPGLRLPGKAVGIAQARREDAMRARRDVYLPDGGAPGFGFHAVLGHVAVRSHGHVKLAAIGAGDEVLGPVVVYRTGGKVHHPDPCHRDAGVAGGIGKPQHRVGVGNVEVMPHERHAERRVERVEQHRSDFGHAIAVGIAQQGDAIGAGHAGAGPLHHQAHHPTPETLAVLRLGWRISLRHQHIAIGQYMKPARMIEASRVRHDVHARTRLRRGTSRPTLGRRDVDRGQQRFARTRKRGLRAGAGGDGQHRHLAAGGEQQRRQGKRKAGNRRHRRPISSRTMRMITTSPRPPLGP